MPREKFKHIVVFYPTEQLVILRIYVLYMEQNSTRTACAVQINSCTVYIHTVYSARRYGRTVP
jgi:hypothetical protein